MKSRLLRRSLLGYKIFKVPLVLDCGYPYRTPSRRARPLRANVEPKCCKWWISFACYAYLDRPPILSVLTCSARCIPCFSVTDELILQRLEVAIDNSLQLFSLLRGGDKLGIASFPGRLSLVVSINHCLHSWR